MIVFWSSLSFDLMRLDVPLLYSEDSLSYIYTYDILRNPWLGTSAATGMPFGSNLFDAPNADGFNLLLIRAFEIVTGQFGTAFNLYLFSTVIIIGACAYAVGRRLGLAPPWAAALSILFNSLPYHIERAGHLFFLNYAPAAVAVWLALDFVAPSADTLRPLRYRWLLVLAATVFCGSSGIYYAFFSCLLLAIAGLFALLEKPSRDTLVRSLVTIGLIGATSFVSMAPALIYQARHESNLEVVQREPKDSEVFGLKLSQMLLPRDGHRIDSWADLKARYSEQSPLVNENKTATLGIIGGIGFLLLLILPFTPRLRQLVPDTLNQMVPLAWMGFLYSTVGGFGVLFAWLVSPQLHSLNRISVFLAFLSLFAFFTFAQVVTRWLRSSLKIVLAIIIVGIGVYDTTPRANSFAPDYSRYIARFDSDRAFATTLDNHLNDGAMLFQLPFVDYPEGKPVWNVAPYDLLTPILHSHHVRWTFGGMRGRPEGRWYQAIAALGMPQMLSALGKTGFEGIVINRNGYADGGVATEQALIQLGLRSDIISPDGTLVHYPLMHTAYPRDMALAVAPGKGWNQLELPEDGPSIWSKGNAEVVVANVASLRRECMLNLNITAANTQSLELVDGSNILAKTTIAAGELSSLAANIEVVPGETKRLLVKTDFLAREPGNGDTRKVAFLWRMASAYACE